MQILNFAHPLAEEQLAKIEDLAGKKISGVINIDSQIDTTKPIEEQIAAMLDRTGLTSVEWQTKPLLVNLPSLNYSAQPCWPSCTAGWATFHQSCGCAPSPIASLPASKLPKS